MATADGVNLPDTVVNGRKSEIDRRPPWLARVAQQVPNWAWPLLLVIADALLIVVAFAAAYFMRYELQWFRAVDPSYAVTFAQYAPYMAAYLVIVLLAFYFSDVYPYVRGRNWLEEVYAIATATTAGTFALIVLNLFFSQVLLSRLIFLYAALLVTALLGMSRILIQFGRAYLRAYGVGVERMVLVGAGDVGRMVMRTVAARPDYGYQLVGFLDDNPAKGNTDVGPFKALGSIDNLGVILDEVAPDSVVICLPWQSHRMIQRLLRQCEQRNVVAQVVPDLFQLTKTQMQMRDLNGIPLFSTRDISIRGWNRVLKRASDLLLAGFGGLVVLPFGLLIALAIRLDSPGPVIYAQTRIGRDGKPFRCFKFRSMVQGADQMREALDEANEASGPLFKLRDDPRRTRVGQFIRRYSLDELPQLVNVLRGEMSLVGPRPNTPEEVEQYENWHRRRLSASPGLTGLWQVSGRSDLTFDEMVLLDIYYVENWNLLLDAGIVLRSIPAVLNGRGAY